MKYPPSKTPVGGEPRAVNIRKEPYDIYIGRPAPWGNPFSHLDNTRAYFRVNNREEAVEGYRLWIQKQPYLMAKLSELRGKVLGCWCKPQSCHANILVELANKKDPSDQEGS